MPRNRFDGKDCCPKCGGVTGYSVNVRAVGYNIHHGAWGVEGGEEILIDQSNLRFTADKSVRCLDCRRRTFIKNLRAA